MLYDLHSHSTASDGALAPAALVALAAEHGVQALALTDHDSVAGLAAAADAAAQHGLEFIPGVEVSVTWQNRVLHVLGLQVNANEPELQRLLNELQTKRLTRAKRMAEKLEAKGVADVWARALAAADGGQVTRTHFARLLVEDGHCADMQAVFKRYLRAGKPGYVKAEWVSLDACINAIHAAGGQAVLAHPHSYNMTGAWRRRMLSAFTDAGGDALEVCCGNSNAQHVELAKRDAITYNLMGSAGSDFHEPAQAWVKLGRMPAMPKAVKPIWSSW